MEHASAPHDSRDKPVVPRPTPEGAKFPFIWLSATGTGCFLAAIVENDSRSPPNKLVQLFGHTLFRMRFAVLAISGMLVWDLSHDTQEPTLS